MPGPSNAAMRRPIRLFSMPGSGTRMMRRNLDCGWHHPTGNGSRQADELYALGKQLIVVVRDPVAVLVTQANYNEQEGQTRLFMDEMWQEFIRFAERGAHVFRVDVPASGRSAELEALETYLGISLPDFEWRPNDEDSMPDTTGAKDAYERKRSHVVVDASRAWCLSKPWLVDFYRPLGYLAVR